ncbi:4'-phosphopantetheinyl transferase superfamily protein [Candidatus Dependentiae bacterium]
MIIGLGIDSVEIERFTSWYDYPEQQLLKILSMPEIEYCKENKQLSAQRFAVRFAAREAFFKAFNSSLPEIYIPFLTCCRSLTLTHNHHGAPQLHINWKLLGFSEPQCTPLISLTHTGTTASASILLQKVSR